MSNNFQDLSTLIIFNHEQQKGSSPRYQTSFQIKSMLIEIKSQSQPYLLGKANEFVYNNILRKQKTLISMNYSHDITHKDNDTSDNSASDSFIPSLTQPAIRRSPKLPKKSKVKMSSFSWSKTQEKKYISFLKGNVPLFNLSAKERKQIKINVMMSYAIKTRTSAQCHSHHQKMMIKYGSIQQIVDNHHHLFEKEIKIMAKEEEAFITPAIETIESIEEPLNEVESKAEPLWWRYLDLMDDQEEQLWNNSYFFSQ